MTAVAPSTIADDLVDLVNQALNFTNAMYGPPEGIPPGKSAWVDYGPVDWEWGLMGVANPTLQITCAVRSNGMYPQEYREATDMAHTVVQALRGQLLLADEAPIVALRQERAGRITFAGETGALMACLITLQVETKQE